MQFIKFQNLLTDEDEIDICYGIHNEGTDYVFCLCCGGIFEKDEYEILDTLPFNPKLLTQLIEREFELKDKGAL